MSITPTSRFVGRRQTNKKQKSIDDEDTSLVPTVEEVSISGLGSYLVVEDDKEHASTGITFGSDSTFRYQHRSSLFSVIKNYDTITKYSSRVKHIIERAEWGGFLTMNIKETPHPLVDYIVERFWDTTNTFHFPFGEMGFTPLDWVMLTGIAIGIGDEIPYDAEKYQFEYVREHIFPDIQDASLCPKGPSWKSNAITVAFLSSYFTKEKLVAAENDNTLAKRIATAFFMYVLGQFFFSNANDYIDAGWLAAFEDLDAVVKYDWGSAAFSRLYSALRLSSRRQKGLCGAFQILEFWGYEYLGICRPEIDTTVNAQRLPRSSAWGGKKKTCDLVRCRCLLNQMTADQVTWQPWESFRNVLGSGAGVTATELSDSRTIFSWINVHNMYLGDRCWRQNHLTFAVPMSQPTNLGKINNNLAKILKEGGDVDATRIVQVVPYDLYIQYWRQVTNYRLYKTHPIWEVEAYGYVGDLHKHSIEKAAENVPIPPQQQISFDEAYTCLQENMNFCEEFRKFTLSQTKERMEALMAKDVQIQALQNRNHVLEVQLSHFNVPQQPQPPLGFGHFSQTMPQQMWNSMSQASTSTISSINPTPRMHMPFMAPRSAPSYPESDSTNG